MKILRILLAAAGLAGAAFFGFCAWALWGPFRSVAVAALLAAVLCLAGGVAALLAGRKDPKAQGPFAASAYELGGPDNAAPDRTVPTPETHTGPRFSGTFLAVSGLDLPEGTRCRLAYEDSCLRVTALDHDFTLAHEKVRTAAILTHKDIRRQYVSSAGGAVAGAMLLGPLGAAMGGAVHARTVRRRDRFLVFGYGDPGEPTRFLVFQVTQWGSRGREFVAAYKKRSGGSVTHVEL